MSSAENEQAWFGPTPPVELTSCSPPPRLLSQGAEARVWLVDLSATKKDAASAVKANVSVGSGVNVPKLTCLSQIQLISSGTTKVICKERFSKKYRHPQLDVSLTKSRTKAEARCLIRCQKAGVSCPNVLAIGQWAADDRGEGNNASKTSPTASCLFLEHISGCTIRHYFEERSIPSSESQSSGEPNTKRARCEEDSEVKQEQDRITTKIDSHTLLVARTLGTLVAQMHAAGIIHGDLTTSNVMLKNPLWVSNESNDDSWIPQLVLIDFGLATSTAPVQVSINNKQTRQHKQQHNAEEKAVDLYVLERAFLSTHPESELLVEEVWKGYRSHYEGLDERCVGTLDGDEDNVGPYNHVANSVMNRLEQVRLRGRKRECFG